MIVLTTVAVVVIPAVRFVDICGPVLRIGWEMFADPLLKGAARAHGRAHHRHRHRAPDREQHGKQNEQPEAKFLHGGIVASAGSKCIQTAMPR